MIERKEYKTIKQFVQENQREVDKIIGKIYSALPATPLDDLDREDMICWWSEEAYNLADEFGLMP